mmetsp:Transcript_27215/g.27611  ORF Transcript_27215/g.27611 Transcript_27215/m.27611 type:complete len:145 (+) Transcript_27215:1-435(+)
MEAYMTTTTHRDNLNSDDNDKDDTANNINTNTEIGCYAEEEEERYTVPLLWDKKDSTIVNNTSSDIVQMLNSEFKDFSTIKPDLDLYPEEHRDEIDEADLLVQSLNSAIYGCGSATTQSQYDAFVYTIRLIHVSWHEFLVCCVS